MASTVKYTVNFLNAKEEDLHRLVDISVALDFENLNPMSLVLKLQTFAACIEERFSIKDMCLSGIYPCQFYTL